MHKSEPQKVLAELEQLGRMPQRLIDLEPLIRSTVQSAALDRRRALRECNFIAAEDWRRVGAQAGRLLQAVEDRAS